MHIRRLLSPILLAGLLLGPIASFAQLPTPTYGFNIGNTLEPPCGEGCWGPVATAHLTAAIADAGFNTVRIPCAWNSHADPATLQIDPAWIARVKEVVDWCHARNLHVILNSHWDGGWLDANLTETVDPSVNAKMKAYWTQIADAFKAYDDRLLFAGANEPPADNAGKMATLITYYQTFIDAVRATGGNNRNRWLVIQGPSTDIELTDALMNTLPVDPTPNRLAVEVHYYTPYQYCLMENDESWGRRFYFWGQPYHHATRTDRNADWGEETFVDTAFRKMADKFIKRGIPVILGEFRAMKRDISPDLSAIDHALHLASRTYFHQYVVEAANRRGIKPIYWETPGNMFDWTTGALNEPDNLRALTGGAALPPPIAAETAPTAAAKPNP